MNGLDFTRGELLELWARQALRRAPTEQWARFVWEVEQGATLAEAGRRVTPDEETAENLVRMMVEVARGEQLQARRAALVARGCRFEGPVLFNQQPLGQVWSASVRLPDGMALDGRGKTPELAAEAACELAEAALEGPGPE